MLANSVYGFMSEFVYLTSRALIMRDVQHDPSHDQLSVIAEQDCHVAITLCRRTELNYRNVVSCYRLAVSY